VINNQTGLSRGLKNRSVLGSLITPKGDWELVVQYDGWPNGLKFHKDGRAFIACYKQGLVVLDPKTGKIEDFFPGLITGEAAAEAVNSANHASSRPEMSFELLKVSDALSLAKGCPKGSNPQRH
jgi:hypothetical protein